MSIISAAKASSVSTPSTQATKSVANEQSAKINEKDSVSVSQEDDEESSSSLNLDALSENTKAKEAEEKKKAEKEAKIRELQEKQTKIKEEKELKEKEIADNEEKLSNLVAKLEEAKNSGDNKKIQELKTQISDIAEKNVGLKGELTKIDQSLAKIDKELEKLNPSSVQTGGNNNIEASPSASASGSTSTIPDSSGSVGGGSYGGGDYGSSGGGSVPSYGGGSYGGDGGGVSSSGAAPIYTGTTTPTQSGNDAVALAQQFLGRDSQSIKGELTNFTAAGGITNNCADFVSALLESTGQLKGHYINVTALENALKEQGWVQVPKEQAQPGDVYISDDNGHTEIVEKNEGGKVTLIGSNGSERQTIKQDSYSANAGGKIYHNPNAPAANSNSTNTENTNN